MVRISIFCLPFSYQVSKAISFVGIVVAQSIIVAKPKGLVQRTLGWPYFQVLFQITSPIKLKVYPHMIHTNPNPLGYRLKAKVL